MVDGQINFKFPENLYVLGTMNAADRSIDSIDLAVRRRFAFVTLIPGRRVVESPSVSDARTGKRPATAQRKHTCGRGFFGRFFEVTPHGDVVWEYVSPYFGPAS